MQQIITKKIATLFLLSLTFSMSVTAETLSFGIVPQQSASKLAKLWTPIFNYISRESGVDIRFATTKNIPVFESRLAKGEYDFSYMNPYHYTVFSQIPGYRAFAHQKNKKIKGIIVVKKDSDISSLHELDQQSLAFPSPAAFAASVLPQAQLQRDNITYQPRYVSSHDSVYLAVSRGLFLAGGGVLRTFNNTDAEVRDNLKILWTTKTYTPHAFAAHPRVPQEKVEKVRRAFIRMNDSEEGQALLRSINFKGMQAAENGDWDDVRGLGIDLLKQLVSGAPDSQ